MAHLLRIKEMVKADFVKRVIPLPDIVDYYFLALRLLSIVAGLVWYLVVPYDPDTKQTLAWVLILYTIYSCILYGAIFRWPRAIRGFYLTTLGVDLFFVFTLVLYVGHLTQSFYIAFYLLVAIHAFYFGLPVALVTAALSSILYAYLCFSIHTLPVVPWPDFILRITFLFLIAVSLGLLAERQKQVRKQVEKLNRELARKNSILERTYRHLSIGKLIGEIAESINSPCGIISVRSEVLMQEARKKKLSHEFLNGLEVIMRSSHQVAQVIKSLLTFSKQKGFEMKVVDLNQLVEETLLLTGSGIKERGIKVEKKLSPALPPTIGDPNELKGVLINLITNAMDALAKGGTIGVTTQLGSKDGAEVTCTVTDNGTGIPEQYMEKIFNPFFTTKGHTGGIGLGLSTSLSVMKKHNGLITVESRPGEGSAFSLSLPCHRR
ncbi:MAG: sensor histidine kinase [Candidatus Binatia bacterium]